MSSTKYEIQSLIRKIEILAVDMPQRNISFSYLGREYYFCTDVLDVETDNKSHMSLQKFGRKYSSKALEEILNVICP